MILSNTSKNQANHENYEEEEEPGTNNSNKYSPSQIPERNYEMS